MDALLNSHPQRFCSGVLAFIVFASFTHAARAPDKGPDGRRLRLSGFIQDQAFDFRSHKPLDPKFYWFDVVTQRRDYRLKVKACDFTGVPSSSSEGYLEVTGLSNTIFEVTVFEPSMLKPNALNVAASFIYHRPFPYAKGQCSEVIWLAYASGTFLGELNYEFLPAIYPTGEMGKAREPDYHCSWQLEPNGSPFIEALAFLETDPAKARFKGVPLHTNFAYRVLLWTNHLALNIPLQWEAQRIVYEPNAWNEQHVYEPLVIEQFTGKLREVSLTDEQIQEPLLVGVTTVADYRHQIKRPDLGRVEYLVTNRWLREDESFKKALVSALPPMGPREQKRREVAKSHTLPLVFVGFTIFCLALGAWWIKRKNKNTEGHIKL